MCVRKDVYKKYAYKSSNTYSFIGVISWDCWPFALLLEAPICANADWRHFPFSPFKFLSSHTHRNSVSITV